MYYEYDGLYIGKDYCWNRLGIMIPDTYHNGLVSAAADLKTSAHTILKNISNRKNFVEVCSTIEDYEVDNAIIIHMDWIDQWGHWLLDGLSNFWPLLDEERPSENIMIIYTVLPSFFPEEYKKYLINQNQFIVPKRIKKAYIPRRTFGIDYDNYFGFELQELQYNDPISDTKLGTIPLKLRLALSYPWEFPMITDKKHLETAQWFGDLHRISPTKIHKKVFLDRRRSGKTNRLIPNIDLLIQKIEESCEWTIFDFGADNISIGDQINILENADVIAGPIGSAFFGLLMTRHFKGKVIYLEKEISEGTRSPYDRQTKIMDLDAEYKNVGTLNDDELEEITNYLMEL